MTTSVASRSDLRDRVAATIGAILRVNAAHIGPFDSFASLGMDSLASVELTAAIEDELGIELSLTAVHEHPSLDALCRHYGIDNSRRTLHGALLDSEILADVYLELIGGRQVALALVEETRGSAAGAVLIAHNAPKRPTPLPSRLEPEQLAAHYALVRTMGEAALWGYYRDEAA